MVDPSAPGGSVKLSAPLVAGGNVYDFALSPDGKSVLYLADQDIDTRYELYRVSLASPGVATKLNPQLLTNRDVMDFVQSPDGSKVVYRADTATIGLYDLFMVDVASPGSATQAERRAHRRRLGAQRLFGQPGRRPRAVSRRPADGRSAGAVLGRRSPAPACRPR